MGDPKLFVIGGDGVAQEMTGSTGAIERTLQTVIERHLEALLGVRLLASAYPTGAARGGRIDTLGLDENHAPVIVEYRRAVAADAVDRWVSHLDWLQDHRDALAPLVAERLGHEEAAAVDWRSARLLCVAADLPDEVRRAVGRLNRNIELLRYRPDDGDLLLLELVDAARPQSVAATAVTGGPAPHGARATPGAARRPSAGPRTVSRLLAAAGPEQRARFGALAAYLLGLGDDVRMKTLTDYVAFRRLKNFACLEVHPQARTILVYVKVDPDAVALEPSFTRDVRTIAHCGTGDLEITIRDDADLERAAPLLRRSYAAC